MLGIVIVSFLSQVCYSLILDIWPCHSVAFFAFVLDIYVFNSKGVSNVARVFASVFVVYFIIHLAVLFTSTSDTD